MVEQAPLFSDLSAEDIEKISEYGQTRSYPKNSILITKGDESDCFYIIKEGKVKVYISDEMGASIILRYEGPGEYFGELASIDEEPRSASVATIEDSRITYVSRNRFEECLNENPALAVKLVRFMSRRIRKLTEELSNCALMPVYQRVRTKLMQLATEEGDAYVIHQRLTHQDLAGLVGCGREMVSRVMGRLQSGGYIHIENKEISIVKDLPRNLH
jgi:CRP/FNR family cyclic AMP-dependent transcriptional regulator